MSKFTYNAINNSGRKIKGTINSSSKIKAVDSLNEENLIVVDIKQNTIIRFAEDINSRIEQNQTIPDKKLILFLVQLQSLLKTGLNIIQASEIILELFKKDKKVTKILTNVFNNLKKGEKFSDSLALYPQVFPPIMINMIAVGEEVGELESVISNLVEYYESRSKNKKQIQTMMVYPSFVFGIAILATLILLFFVVPKFVGMYGSSDKELPAITQTVVNLSNALRNNWGIYITTILLSIASFTLLKKNKHFKKFIDKLLFKLPKIKNVLMFSNLVFISSSLSLMFENGYDKLKSLELTRKHVTNAIYDDYLYLMYINIYNGNRLLADIEPSIYIPIFFRQMITIGEEAGNLDRLLKKSSEYYQERLDQYIGSLKSLIEPMLILLIIIIIMPIIIAVVLPMFDIYSQM